MRPSTIDQALEAIGTGPFQRRLLAIFGLVWAADAMQVLAIGFAAPSLAASFGLSIPQAIQAGTAFVVGMLLGAWGFGRLADRLLEREAVAIAMKGVTGQGSIDPDGQCTLIVVEGISPQLCVIDLQRQRATGRSDPVEVHMLKGTLAQRDLGLAVDRKRDA